MQFGEFSIIELNYITNFSFVYVCDSVQWTNLCAHIIHTKNDLVCFRFFHKKKNINFLINGEKKMLPNDCCFICCMNFIINDDNFFSGITISFFIATDTFII